MAVLFKPCDTWISNWSLADFVGHCNEPEILSKGMKWPKAVNYVLTWHWAHCVRLMFLSLGQFIHMENGNFLVTFIYSSIYLFIYLVLGSDFQSAISVRLYLPATWHWACCSNTSSNCIFGFPQSLGLSNRTWVRFWAILLMVTPSPPRSSA